MDILNYKEEDLVLDEGVNDPGIFKAIILAGGPGSGTSHVAEKLGLKALGLRVVNSDAFLTMLMKKKGLSLKMPADENEEREAARMAAKALTSKLLNNVIDARLGIIVDSTSGDQTKTVKIISKLRIVGYDVKVIEESVALAYEGLVDNDLTGIAISMGAGMCNVCVMYQGMSSLSFSVARGGDWIDENVAADCGVTVAKVIAVKENSSNLDLTKSAINDIYQEGSDEYNIINAIRSYYGALVNYLLTNLAHQFNNTENVPNFPESIPVAFGGGTALVKGFMEVVNEQFNQDDFPIQIKEFTLVEDAHTAVARGCLSEAQLIEEEEGETNEEST